MVRGDGEAHSKRGIALAELGRYGEALASFGQAIALNPGEARFHSNRGVALAWLGRYEEAVASHDRAIALNPTFAGAHRNRGIALASLGRHEEAVVSFDRAIALMPGHAETWSHRGATLTELGLYDKAVASYENAIALRPDFAEASFNLSLCLLLLGRFEPAWRLFEARKRLAVRVSDQAYAQPLWLGDVDVAGKTVLIHAEGGHGDTIQFCRYAGRVRALGAKVILAAQAPLVRLLRQMEPEIRVVALDETPPAFDVHCPIMSLPLAFDTMAETIPAETRYLRAGEQDVSRWAARLKPRTKRRIGLAWNGNPAHLNDKARSIALTTLLPLLAYEADWVCLQNALRPEDEAVLWRDGRIAHYGDEIRDFGDTAALVDLMDLVVSVDTGVAHLAGAMGKAVWLMLPFNPDWRWQLGRPDSPWYPSMRLFRQQAAGDWAGVVGAVTAQMAARGERSEE